MCPNNHLKDLIDMNNRKSTAGTTADARPTREDMLAFVANGRQRPNIQGAICLVAACFRKVTEAEFIS
jgi:hypothetical protein